MLTFCQSSLGTPDFSGVFYADKLSEKSSWSVPRKFVPLHRRLGWRGGPDNCLKGPNDGYTQVCGAVRESFAAAPFLSPMFNPLIPHTMEKNDYENAVRGAATIDEYDLSTLVVRLDKEMTLRVGAYGYPASIMHIYNCIARAYLQAMNDVEYQNFIHNLHRAL